MRVLQILALCVASLTAASAAAQSYPGKSVRVIVPFAAGGATDIVARVVAQKLGETWGQQVVVDNRAGAGGNIGGELAAKSTPDGYTLFMTSGSIITANQHIYKKMPFDPAKDLVPVINVANGPQVLIVTPTFPPKTVKELIALAKAHPREISYGSAGFGSQTHLAAENFLYAAKIEIVHIPYKGEAPAIVDTMAGQVPFSTPNLAAAINYIQQKKLRALGVTSKQRSPQLPDVPAVAETVPGFENLGWFGFVVPTGTPKDVIDKIYRDTAKALEAADIKSRFEGLGMAPVGSNPAEFGKYIRDETERWAKIVRERKLQVD
ncbi:MAG: tripartite tricarboxylate transporter substrate binding protein [Betaproteobacteria bacterium]|nr:tripartite tricarboxylate transporter substrate binding protein [Betaproteobacteria bacterium]